MIALLISYQIWHQCVLGLPPTYYIALRTLNTWWSWLRPSLTSTDRTTSRKKKRLGPIHSSKYIYPVFNMSVLSSRVDVMKRIVKCLNVISVWMGWVGQIFVLVCFKMFTQLYFKAKELETKKKSCHILKYSEIVFLTRAEGKSPKNEVVRGWREVRGPFDSTSTHLPD